MYVNPEPDTGRIFPDDYYAFYCISTWTTRKSVDLLLTAFLEEFTADDPVCLILKTDHDNYTIPAPAGWKEDDHEFNPPELSAWYSLARKLGSYSNPPQVHLIAKRNLAHRHRRCACSGRLLHQPSRAAKASESAVLKPFSSVIP